MTVKGKRARITDENHAMIMHYALKTPRIARTKLAEQLQVELEWQGPAPEVEVLERKISWFRNHVTDDPQDKPWSMATLDKYPIPPEALPAVLQVWKFRVEKGDTFTIREAKWASRLSRLLEDIEKLSYKASQYARTELMYELIKRPFDSTDLDRLLMGLPVGIEDITSMLPLLAGQEDGIDQIQDFIKGKRKKLTFYPFGRNAISEEAPHISLGLARQLSEKEVNHEGSHKKEG